MPTVWIPSLPHRYDAATQQMVPSHDVNAAAEYGKLAVIVDGPIDTHNIKSALAVVRSAPIDQDDFIMAIGDVVLIAAAIAAAPSGIRVLRWDKRARTYSVLEV